MHASAVHRDAASTTKQSEQHRTCKEQNMAIPIGTIMAFAGPISPAWEQANGWLLCDGRSLDRTAQNQLYMPLFNAIGSSWGGDGVNMFNVPDLRGRFLRGVDGGSARDPDIKSRAECNPGGHAQGLVGSVQEDQIDSHTHGVNDPTHSHGFAIFDNGHAGNGGIGEDFPRNARGAATNPSATGITLSNTGGNETRPKNAYVYWIISFK
jgi:microcystin-dependent protein